MTERLQNALSVSPDYQQFVRDAAAYLQWCLEHADDVSLASIGATLGHDLRGLLTDERCFSPRVTGYYAMMNPPAKPSRPYEEEVRMVLTKLTEAGWKLVKVDNGEEVIYADGIDVAVEHVLSVDESRVIVTAPHAEKPETGWLYFVLGNESGVAVADYGSPKDEGDRKKLDAIIWSVAEHYDAV